MPVVIHMKAPNDRNGNPRRLFLITYDDGRVRAVDEGYEGTAAFRDFAPKGTQVTAECKIGAAEYRRLLKLHG